jgi:3-deoxy-D-manno-octulosonic-acid transferase
MSWPLGIYRVLTGLAFFAVFPFLLLYRRGKGRYADRLDERLGYYPPEIGSFFQARPERPIWFQAVSVGEVKLAASLTRRIRSNSPRCRCWFPPPPPPGVSWPSVF